MDLLTHLKSDYCPLGSLKSNHPLPGWLTLPWSMETETSLVTPEALWFVWSVQQAAETSWQYAPGFFHHFLSSRSIDLVLNMRSFLSLFATVTEMQTDCLSQHMPQPVQIDCSLPLWPIYFLTSQHYRIQSSLQKTEDFKKNFVITDICISLCSIRILNIHMWSSVPFLLTRICKMFDARKRILRVKEHHFHWFYHPNTATRNVMGYLQFTTWKQS